MTEAVQSQMTLELDDAGFVRLRWSPGLTISGDMAREAVSRLAAVCDGRRLPMLVDMTSTAVLTRPARVVFGGKTCATRIALLGKSAVDRVMVNFALSVNKVLAPTRFFTDERLAIAWLTGHGDTS